MMVWCELTYGISKYFFASAIEQWQWPEEMELRAAPGPLPNPVRCSSYKIATKNARTNGRMDRQARSKYWFSGPNSEGSEADGLQALKNRDTSLPSFRPPATRKD